MTRHQWITKSGPRVIGEFVLIVSSVLVALAVDQYVETRKERSLERQYLSRLLDDVVATAESLQNTKGTFRRAEIAARYLDSLFRLTLRHRSGREHTLLGYVTCHEVIHANVLAWNTG